MIRKRPINQLSSDEESEFENTLSSCDNNHITREWRKNLKSVRDKLAHIFDNNDIPRDITFLVGTGEHNLERISAHKFILQLASPVFESFIRNKSANDKENNDENVDVAYYIQDTEPEAFKYLLKFMYTDEIDIDAASPNILISLLDLVRKYEIDDLTEICCKKLKASITTDNAVCIMNIATKLKYLDLHEIVLNFVLRNGTEILKSLSFLELSYENICFILKDDRLVASELLVFQSALRWAQKRCSISMKYPSPINIRVVMRDILYLVRFPLMNPDKFVLNVISTGILVSEEKAEILQYLSVSDTLKPDFVPNSFSCQLRHGLQNCSSMISNGLNSCINASEFPFLQNSVCGDPTNILMKNCTLDLASFLKKCSNLHYKTRNKVSRISFENIKLTNYDENGIEYIRFPNLKVFHLIIICANANEEELQIVDVLRSNFGRFLFFTKKSKHYPWPWPLTFIWSLNVNVLISLNGIVFLNVNHETQSVVINQLDQVCSILKCLKASEDVKKFTIAFKVPLPVNETLIRSNLSPPIASVEVLTLHFAYHIQNITKYVSLFHNLRELTLVRCEYKSIELDFSITFTQKIRKIAIQEAKIELLCNETSLQELEEIILWNCRWEESFEDRFISTFQNLREIHLYNSFVDKPLYKLLSKIIQLKHVEKIIVSGFMWGNYVSGIHAKSVTNNSAKTEIEQFLRKAGLRRNCHPSFCLTKNYNTKNFEGFSWVARKLMDDEVSQELFHQFHFDKFYTDFGTFKIRFPQDY